MVRQLLFLILSLNIGPLAMAEDDPLAWFNSLKLTQSKSSAYPANIVFVKRIPKKGQVTYETDIAVEEFNQLGFIKFANWRNSDWNFKLNRDRYAKSASKKLIYKMADADTIIETDKKWRINHVSFKSPQGHMPPPADMKAKTLSEWFTKNMGWDGVVLDQKGDRVLVGSTTEILSQPQIQALAISGSSSKLIIKSKDRKGSGLLSLQEIKGSLGIFDIVFLGKGRKNLPVGTKLIIERKAK